MKKLRSKGLCILFLHHAGKSGLQRGSSKSEDLLDISIKLSHPKDYKVTDGLRLVLEFDKTRGVCMLDGAAIEVQMQLEKDSAIWTYCLAEDAQYRAAKQMFEAGSTVRDVAKEFNVSHGLAGKWRLDWKVPRVSSLREQSTQSEEDESPFAYGPEVQMLTI
jgi:putative DNA primase/helicase